MEFYMMKIEHINPDRAQLCHSLDSRNYFLTLYSHQSSPQSAIPGINFHDISLGIDDK